MRRSKDKFYMKQILDCIMDGEVYATGKRNRDFCNNSMKNKSNNVIMNAYNSFDRKIGDKEYVQDCFKIAAVRRYESGLYFKADQ